MLVYACSTNRGKLREFALAAAAADVHVETLPGLAAIEPPAEDGESFGANAALKAIYYSQFTHEIVLADDSGLCVDALNGAPGIHSARFAGESATPAQNNALLLERLSGVVNRRARFVCVIALARRRQLLGTASGTVEGEILHEPRGSGGFGYDPLFFYPPLGRSFGELSDEEKLQVSARGMALSRAFAALTDRSISQA